MTDVKVKNIPQFAKFTLSSVFCTIIDISLFIAFEKLFVSLEISEKTSVFIATWLARTVDTAINFLINKIWCFKSEHDTLKQTVLFFLLAITKVIFSSFIVAELIFIPLPNAVTKLAVDAVIFIFSFFIQKIWIFKTAGEEK